MPTLNYTREEYQRLWRLWRKGELWDVPSVIQAHFWEIEEYRREKQLPERFQYKPVSQQMIARRDDLLSGYGGSMYEYSQGW